MKRFLRRLFGSGEYRCPAIAEWVAIAALALLLTYLEHVR